MKGYQQHEAFVADVRMYWKMAVYALGLGLVLQVAAFGWLAREAWDRQFVVPLADGRAFTVPFRSVLKCLAPPLELFGRETRYEVEPPLRPFFQREGVPERRVTAGVYRAVMEKYFGDRIAASPPAYRRRWPGPAPPTCCRPPTSASSSPAPGG